MKKLAVALVLAGVAVHGQAPAFDIIVRGGTVIDGSGNPRYDADLAIRNGFIAAIGDLGSATAATQIDARGLYVTPGFINIHSHAFADAVRAALIEQTALKPRARAPGDHRSSDPAGWQLSAKLEQFL